MYIFHPLMATSRESLSLIIKVHCSILKPNIKIGKIVIQYIYILYHNCIYIYIVGPCHHGMARPQVADRGTASDKEGSCE